MRARHFGWIWKNFFGFGARGCWPVMLCIYLKIVFRIIRCLFITCCGGATALYLILLLLFRLAGLYHMHNASCIRRMIILCEVARGAFRLITSFISFGRNSKPYTCECVNDLKSGVLLSWLANENTCWIASLLLELFVFSLVGSVLLDTMLIFVENTECAQISRANAKIRQNEKEIQIFRT